MAYSKIPWSKIFGYYISSEKVSYQMCADKFGVSIQAVKEHGVADEWVAIKKRVFAQTFQNLPMQTVSYNVDQLSQETKLFEAFIRDKTSNPRLRKLVLSNEGIGIVYILGNSKMSTYKIGKSRNYLSRRQAIRTGNPISIDVEIVLETKNEDLLEKMLHKAYKEKQVSGEWFNLSPSDILEIQEKFFPNNVNYHFTLSKEVNKTI